MKVLIVDDSAPTRTLAKDILASAWTVEVLECSNGQAALEALADWRPDLVLLDYEMQPMNGAELTRALRSGGAGVDPMVPVIMMTGHADREHVIAARKAGVDGFIVKPLTIRSVLERVHAVRARPRDTIVIPA